MLLGLLIASLAHAAPALEPSPSPSPREVGELAAVTAPFGVLVVLEETRLVAISRSPEPFVLVLASPGRGPMVARTLAAGTRLESQHPPFSLAGLTLEILVAPGGRLASSGRLVLDGSPLTLGVEVSTTAEGVARLHVASDKRAAQGPGSLPFPSAAPLHVPIPSPSDKPPGDFPPPIENEPLPPV